MVRHEVNKDDLVAFQFHFIDSDKRSRIVYGLLQGLGGILLLFVLNIVRNAVLHHQSSAEKPSIYQLL